MSVVGVAVRRLAHAADLPLPCYASSGAAGADVCAAVDKAVTLLAGERVSVPTGLVCAVPEGFEVQVRPRSGLARSAGVTVVNAPGTIDSDYRGELVILLVNLGSQPWTVRRGDRIAQLVVAPVVRAVFAEVEVLPATERGVGGFGSTGS